MLLYILFAVLIFSLVGGAWGHSSFGYAGWSPAGIVVLILIILYFTGHVSLR